MAEAFGHHDFEDHHSRQIARDFEEKIRKNEFFFMDLDRVARIYDFYAEGQEWNRANHLMDFAIETFPTNSLLYYQKAYSLYELGKYKLAEKAIDHSLNLNPYTRDYLCLKADILAKLARYEEAIELLQTCMAFVDKKEEILLYMGNVAQICQRPIQSENFYREALKENENYEEALVELAYLYEGEGRLDKGISLCLEFLDENPYSHKTWFYLGSIYHKVHQNEKALDAIEYALVIKEDFEDAHFKKGEILLEEERHREAIQAFFEALSYGPENIHTLYHIGECYENLESFHDAIKYFGQVTRQDPDHIDGWMGLGFCLERSEKYLEAIHYYQKAHKLDNENPELCLAMAICEYKLGQRYNAYLYLEQALSLTPDDISIWQDWAQLLYDHKNPVGAVTYLEEGIKINPGSPSLYYYCSAYCFEAKMAEKGLAYLENGLILAPEKSQILFDILPEIKKLEEVQELMDQYKD